jgi:hypothetical protein
LTQLQQSSARALLPRAMETIPGLSCHAIFFENQSSSRLEISSTHYYFCEYRNYSWTRTK